MNGSRIRVLVAEDSLVSRQFLVHLLESDPRLHVVGAVADGQAAVDLVPRAPPDVVLMDLHMPRLDGFEATRRIMATRAVPIVICSATATVSDRSSTFRAMEAGAIACVEKPLGAGRDDFEALATHLLDTVKLMSEVKVVRRTTRPRVTRPLPGDGAGAPRRVQVVGIGGSTGGPPALQTILAALPKDFPVPVLVVQHISQGFLAGMAEWLDETTGLRVHIAAHETPPLPGHVYLAPDGFHLGVRADGVLRLARDAPEHGLRPAVSFLFRSLAEVHGPRAVGVLLTGMGSDGAAELKQLRDRGATTLAQDRDSSVVHGMPGVAIALGAATHVLPPDRIAATLAAVAGSSPARFAENP
jgi:two-component system, chemotaxis family, protein-glutamate methylesterase/glutaminase